MTYIQRRFEMNGEYYEGFLHTAIDEIWFRLTVPDTYVSVEIAQEKRKSSSFFLRAVTLLKKIYCDYLFFPF
ncbi:MAG: hypothetical protein DRP01_08810 [Archaeoglobales archaeon]|nr:MAG: hypothetical protein DRP01_08810 [Archaeoglobales archaeon]